MAGRKKIKKEPAHTVEELLIKHEGILARGSSNQFDYDRIAFGIPALDDLIGGGIPRKRITILSGQSNAGKSYLAGQSVVSVQKSGGIAAWIDTEMSWDSSWMEKCGVDLDKMLLSQPMTGEDAFNLIRSLMDDGVDLIVLDSIAGIVPANMAVEEDFSFNPMAWQARFINQSIPRLMPYLKNGSAFIAINQVRQSIGNVSFLDSLPGGKAQTFFAHLVLQIRRSGWIEEKGEKIGFDVLIMNRKTKSGGRDQQSCIIPFKFGAGFDIVETYIREAMKYDIIKQSGAWYQIMGEERKVSGMNGVKEFFIDNPNKLKEMMETVDNNGENLDLISEINVEIDDNIPIKNDVA